MKIYGALFLNDELRAVHVFRYSGLTLEEARVETEKRLVRYIKDERLNQGKDVLIRVSEIKRKAITRKQETQE